jgi:hypothetical protein
MEDFITNTHLIITELPFQRVRIIVIDFGSKSNKGGGSVIPLLKDTLEEWRFLQVMTQVIGQES